MSARTPTPFDAVFDALEQRMGVVHLTTWDATPSQGARVVWAPAGAVEPRPIPYRVAGERTRGRNAHPWTATIYAATHLEVTNLLHQFEAHLEDVIGPPQGAAESETLQAGVPAPVGRGYEIKAGKIEPRGLDGTATQFAADVQVTLYTRARTRVRGTVDGSPSLHAYPLDPESLATPAEVAWPAA